jgi:hypothetical protein
MGYIMLMGLAIYLLDSWGIPSGLKYSAALIGLNVVLMVILVWVVDRGSIVKGATARTRRAPGAAPARTGPVAPKEGD